MTSAQSVRIEGWTGLSRRYTISAELAAIRARANELYRQKCREYSARTMIKLSGFGCRIELVRSESLRHGWALWWVIGRNAETCRIGGLS